MSYEERLDDELEPDVLTLDLPSRSLASQSFHPWFGIRSHAHATAAVAFTLTSAEDQDAVLRTAITQHDQNAVREALLTNLSKSRSGTPHVVALCGGVGTAAATASALGCTSTNVEEHVVPHLMCRLLYMNSLTVDASALEARRWAEDGQRQRAHRVSGSGWRGLSVELRAAVEKIIASIETKLEWKTQDNLVVKVWARCWSCTSCGLSIPLLSQPILSHSSLNPSRRDSKTVVQLHVAGEDCRIVITTGEDDTDAKPNVRRNELLCPRCAATTPLVRLAYANTLFPLAEGRSQLDSTLLSWSNTPAETPAAMGKTETSGTTEISKVKIEQKSPYETILDPDAVWCEVAGKEITSAEALLPSQRKYISAALTAIAELEQQLADRHLSRSQKETVIIGVSLLLTSHVLKVSTMATWEPRRGVVTSPLNRAIWSVPAMFPEAGPSLIRRWWLSGLEQMIKQLGPASIQLSNPVDCRLADPSSTGLPSECADAVIWDPPYYDSTNHIALARPWNLTLSATPIAVLASPILSSRGDSADSTSVGGSRFNNDRYVATLKSQADEARRLLHPLGKIGVFWYARNSNDLQDFLNIIAGSGLELQRVVKLNDRNHENDIRYQEGGNAAVTHLLLLRPVHATARGSRSQVDAGRVLELADVGAPSLYEGLARLLFGQWDAGEISRHLQPLTKKTSLSAVADYVASHPRPEDLLLELGRPALLRMLQELGDDEVAIKSADSRMVPHAILRLLGFSIYQPAMFTISGALHEGRAAVSRLKLSQDLEQAAGSFSIITTEVERILRYASVTWAKAAYGEDWEKLIAAVVKVSSSKEYRNLNSMSFGDWKSAFCAIPGWLRDESHCDGIFVAIAEAIKREKSTRELSDLVRIRNSVGHGHASLLTLPTPEIVDQMNAVSMRALKALGALNEARALPMTLQPEEERRDRYGRRSLRLIDVDRSAIEIFVSMETDMSQPIVYVPSGIGLRSATPILMTTQDIETAAGIV
ncbi:hypothetical protein OHA77_24695 [Streptosporangium sp. NBC_01639]|uniref:hypothetical protein n=1 Tax=Streptosporangium sp. NBC_01639 TaxID=2975948 RepID=UPI00386C31CB|nr:hypothetical protein OHA77_24695 [Streptosporangium sp. NBC_01639]